jgi:triosephosphate isomerase
MTKTISEARSYVQQLNANADWPANVQPFILPPHTLVDVVRSELDPITGMWVGAQNAHWMPNGAYTGEVSMAMIKDAGAILVEIGHSERRTHFHETDETVNLKVRAALSEGLVPLICVGETADVRDRDQSISYVIGQLAAALEAVNDADQRKVFVAYEPVWSIGEHGIPASPEHVAAIAEAVRERFEVRAFLYGGSVTVENALHYLSARDVDGIFVGRSAWEADGLLSLVNQAGTHVSAAMKGKRP